MSDPAVHELRAWCPQLVFLAGAWAV